MPCGYVPPQDGSLAGMLDYVDCQAQTIGSQGYLALAAPGSPASLALTGLLTILVALYGYRLLLGQGPGVRDVVLMLIKVGIVVALATGWAGYRVLFYDLVLHGPAEITAVVGGASGLPGATGGLAAHIDGTDRLFQSLAVANQRPLSVYQDTTVIAPPLFAGFNTFALGWSRVTFLVGAIGAFAAVRLTAGLLLALGPLFIAFLLFDTTRGLFAGWIRVLAGAALGAVATSIALGVELAIFEPWLTDLVARRSSDQPIAGAPAQLLATALVFNIALIVVVGAIARVAWSLDLKGIRWAVGTASARGEIVERLEPGRVDTRMTTHFVGGRSRAAALADAVNATERRETTMVTTGASGSMRAATSASSAAPTSSASLGGRSSFSSGGTGRRTSSRISASAGRRDAVR